MTAAMLVLEPIFEADLPGAPHDTAPLLTLPSCSPGGFDSYGFHQLLDHFTAQTAIRRGGRPIASPIWTAIH
jgi:hypothetical protein